MRCSWFAVVAPGLEAIAVRELRGLMPQHSFQSVPGGVQFEASQAEGAALTLRCRTPARILAVIGRGRVRSWEDLRALVARVDWKPWFDPRASVEVAHSAEDSRLHDRQTCASVVTAALQQASRAARHLGVHRPWPRMAQRVSVRISGEEATISVDAGGELLHIRGWRQSQGKAPLRENLAASLLHAAGYSGDGALVDPFCGAGTICIEAALLASGRLPGRGRWYACEEWPGLDRQPWKPRISPTRLAHAIVGLDKEPRAITAAMENAERAKVEGLEWRHLDVAELEAPAPAGVLVTNPPYGLRLGQDVRGVYATFGRVLRERFTGWRALFLSPSPDLASAVDRRVERVTFFSNGGERVSAWGIEL
jgi:putative N6-adenine-specific DNA methylase